MASAVGIGIDWLLSDRELERSSLGLSPSVSSAARSSNDSLIYVIEVPWRGIEIKVVSEDNKIQWIAPMAERLEQLLRLPKNWNSYEASEIRVDVVLYSLESVLPELLTDEIPLPVVTPTSDGGVIFEWHEQGIDLEIAVRDRNQVSVMYEDARDGAEWEWKQAPNWAKIAELVSEIKKRRA